MIKKGQGRKERRKKEKGTTRKEERQKRKYRGRERKNKRARERKAKPFSRKDPPRCDCGLRRGEKTRAGENLREKNYVYDNGFYVSFIEGKDVFLTGSRGRVGEGGVGENIY